MSIRKFFALGLAISVVSSAFAQAPWPMEKQDRYGTGRAPAFPSPSEIVPPWKEKIVALNTIVSFGPALGEDGVGFFGTWVQNFVTKFDVASLNITGTFNALNFVHGGAAIGPNGYVYLHVPRHNSFNPTGRVIAINPSNMDFEWFFNTDSDIVNDYEANSPTIGPDGDIVIGNRHGKAWRLNGTTGAVVWERTGLSECYRTIVFTRDDSKVIVASGSLLTALNYSNGTVAWSKNLGSHVGGPATSPEGPIVVGTAGGRILGINPDNGDIIWERAALGGIRPSPAFSADGYAYVCSDDFRVYKIKVSDGTRPWSFTANHENRTPPVVDANGRIYWGARTGTYYCLNPDGTLAWSHFVPGADIRGPGSLGPDGRLYFGTTAGLNASGLYVIRMVAAHLFATNFSIPFATHLGGNLNSLSESDDDRIRAGINEDSPRGIKIAGIQVETTFPADAAHRFKIEVEASGSHSFLEQTLELWNKDTSAWEVVDLREAATADEMFTVEINTSPDRFIGSNRVVKARLLYTLNSRTRSEWYGQLDRIRFIVQPVFQAIG